MEASIGSALYPLDVDKAGKLMQAADVAMYAAKKAGSGHEFYSPGQHQYTPARLGLVAQLNRAMAARELVLHYQPKARLATGTVEGVEALARWNHPQRGLLFPDDAEPAAPPTTLRSSRDCRVFHLSQPVSTGSRDCRIPCVEFCCRPQFDAQFG